MLASEAGQRLEVVEICAGAGGQSLGLERAGFHHRLAVEIDPNAAATLKANRSGWEVRVGDVADPAVWDPAEYEGIDLLAGGVPCPPFSFAGKQNGATDERDLFAWAIETCGVIKPRALLLENVRGLSAKRFSAYRQVVLDKLTAHGYIGNWKLLHASDFGVPQLRPRFVLVALQEEYAKYFKWPEPHATPAPTVGEALKDLMGARGWPGVDEWVARANDIAPTIVGGSKKHGGADLGPTRAKRAWAALGVDALGVADEAPGEDWKPAEKAPGPKLTTEMVARIQGWNGFEDWTFTGRKTSKYRQIGNAFPPPVAEAVGSAIARALRKEGEPVELIETGDVVHDPVYKLLRGASRALTPDQIIVQLSKIGTSMDHSEVERHLHHLSQDFSMKVEERADGNLAYSLGEFKAFIGQEDHRRHEFFARHRSKVS